MKNRFASNVAVFVLGFVVCALVFYGLFGGGASGPTRIMSVDSPHPALKVSGSNQIAQAAGIVSKYVVSIDTVGKPMLTAPGGGFFGFGEPQEVVPKGKGSGVIISPDGYIVTNNHVVEGAATLTVTLHDGKQYEAKLIGRDPKTDIAVIKIGASGLEYAAFGNSDSLHVGDWVIAVGNALGLGPTVTVGVISATKRGPIRVENETLEDVIQTDAAINRGNSGGALADLNGDLIGINTAIASAGPDGGSIGIGFAVPSSTAEKIAKELIKSGKVRRPWLGIYYQPYNAEVRKSLEDHGARGLPKDDGALVREVMQDSPAADAGLQPYDVIMKIDNKPLSGTGKAQKGKTTISDEIGSAKVGSRVMLQVWHSATGRVGTVGVRVGEMPVDTGQPPQQQSPEGFPFP